MTKLKIEQGTGNVILRKRSEEITISGKKDVKKLKKLFKDMRETMKTTNGVGLAAPQVSENIRACVCLFNQDTKDERIVDMINPVITQTSEEMEVGEEGCLSLPGDFGMVARHAMVTVRYMDIKGEQVALALKGLNAVVVQHEIDHLDGKLFVDRIEEQLLIGQHIL